ncbi:MAG: tRNA (guanosine(37)-N1)-methyltransferase TrmD [Oscillospiraceae bacterium]
MKIDILTIFPEIVDNFLSESIIGRARKNNKVIINCHNIRDYTKDKHNRTDDYPYGGGQGMIFMADPLYNCYNSVITKLDKKPITILMSPRGKVLTQQIAKDLAFNYEHIILICGHYEGIDQRLIDEIVDFELSIGDYVLTGGEIAAVVVSDCVCRLVSDVLKNDICYEDESHYNGLLEYDHYTRPAVWLNTKVPDVLLSGNHKNIEDYRKKMSLKNTYFKRPDLLNNVKLTKDELIYIETLKKD